MSERVQEQRDPLYEIMKGRAYGVAEIATGCTNAEAIQRGYSDVYGLLMSDSDDPRQAAFLTLLPSTIESEGHRRILLDGLARQFTDLPGWLAYVDRETRGSDNP